MLPTGFRTFHFISFLYVFFFSFLFLLFRFFSHYFVFVFLRFFSLLFSLFSFRFFSFRFFSFLFVFFRFSVYRYPIFGNSVYHDLKKNSIVLDNIQLRISCEIDLCTKNNFEIYTKFLYIISIFDFSVLCHFGLRIFDPMLFDHCTFHNK